MRRRSQRILVEGYRGSGRSLHICGTAHKLRNIDTTRRKWQQAHGSEYREATSNIVWNDECRVSLLVERLLSAPRAVCHSDDTLRSTLLIRGSISALMMRNAIAGSVVVPDFEITIVAIE